MAVHDLDLAAFDLVQSVHAQWLDVFSSFVGLFGQAEITGAIALGMAIARWRHGRRDAIVPLFILATVVIEAALKLLIPQAPPPHDRSRTVALLPFIHAPFASSFPSGHVARAAFLLTIARGIPLLGVAAGIALMTLTRIYLGEHWLSDTIGGILLGVGVGLSVASLTRS